MKTITSTLDLEGLLQAQRNHAPVVARTTARQRRKKLDTLLAYLDQVENKQRLLDALRSDLRKHEVETLSSEVGVVYSHVKYVKRQLKRWMQPRKVATPIAMLGTKSYIYPEPKGCALIIAPWNYPFNLSIVPLIYAIAAGCTVTLKPSEFSPATTAFIEEMLRTLFTREEVAVVTGDGEVSAKLTSLPYNHIYFTGSPAIGKKVMAAAAENLTSVTLELGGKSPCVVDADVDIKASARNTAWGKFFNAGQTCIAPDYLLVKDSISERYLEALEAAITTSYGENIQQSESLARIVNENHFDRLVGLLEDAIERGATVAFGGHHDRSELYIEPTILTDVTPDMRVMQEEIFGPIWPMLTFSKLEDVVDTVRELPRPLAFYIQANNRDIIKYLLRETHAGGTVINEQLLGAANPALPFGGINNSGIGKGFGHHGFLEFTNERGVLERKFFNLTMAYPPYTERVREIMGRIYKWM